MPVGVKALRDPEVCDHLVEHVQVTDGVFRRSEMESEDLAGSIIDRTMQVQGRPLFSSHANGEASHCAIIGNLPVDNVNK